MFSWQLSSKPWAYFRKKLDNFKVTEKVLNGGKETKRPLMI